MRSPGRTSAELRRIANMVLRDRISPARELAAILASDSYEEYRKSGDFDGLVDNVGGLELAGPFGRFSRTVGNFHTLEAEFVVTGEAWTAAVGEDERWRTRHEVTVEVNWDYTSPEPSVGWTGGYSFDGYEVVAIDGRSLDSPADVKAATSYLEDRIEEMEGPWADEKRDSAADYGGYDDYD